MSNISTVYDAILTRLGSLFPTKTRMPNAYSEIDNAEHLFRDAYGLRYDGDSLAIQEFNAISSDHNFTVIFYREAVRVENEFATLDVVVKNLLEDASITKKDFYEVDGIGTTAAKKITPSSTSGITQVYSDKNNFFKIEIPFTITIDELYPCP